MGEIVEGLRIRGAAVDAVSGLRSERLGAPLGAYAYERSASQASMTAHWPISSN
jgi:hypothetical protein